MDITKKLIKYNFSKGLNTKEYIVIHDTGNYNKGAGALNHYEYFNGADRGASAHYFVDSELVLQLVMDNDRSWHCGVKYGDNPPRKEVTNRNSIGIEICVNPESDVDKAFNNTVELTKYLMGLYNIPVENVVRHYDACLKICPSSLKDNNWQMWNDFKVRLKESEEVITQEKFIINNKEVLVDTILKDGKNYTELRSLCNGLGVLVEYDISTKKVSLSTKIDTIKLKLNGIIKDVNRIFVKDKNYIELRSLSDNNITVGYDENDKMPFLQIK